jgi:hypothetical protein
MNKWSRLETAEISFEMMVECSYSVSWLGDLWSIRHFSEKKYHHNDLWSSVIRDHLWSVIICDPWSSVIRDHLWSVIICDPWSSVIRDHLWSVVYDHRDPWSSVITVIRDQSWSKVICDGWNDDTSWYLILDHPWSYMTDASMSAFLSILSDLSFKSWQNNFLTHLIDTFIFFISLLGRLSLMLVPAFARLVTMYLNRVTRDRCFDFKNIFAKKKQKNWRFWLKTKINYAKFWS